MAGASPNAGDDPDGALSEELKTGTGKVIDMLEGLAGGLFARARADLAKATGQPDPASPVFPEGLQLVRKCANTACGKTVRVSLTDEMLATVSTLEGSIQSACKRCGQVNNMTHNDTTLA